MDINNHHTTLSHSASPNSHQNGQRMNSITVEANICSKSPVEEGIKPPSLLEPVALPIFNISKDLDRESLGILPNMSKDFDTDFLKIRESLSFSKNSPNHVRDSVSFGLSLNLPRESLGILNISSMDVGRESMKIMNVSSLIGKESLTPRESLGVMNMAFLETQALDITSDLSFRSPSGTKGNVSVVPEILLHLEEDKLNSNNELNVGFLIAENSRKVSAVSSGSVSPSFNSGSLNEPSKIINSKLSFTPDDKDVFNNAIEGSSNFHFSDSDTKSSVSSIHSSNSNLSSNANDLKKFRARIQSMPVMLEEKSFEIVTRNHSYSGMKQDSFNNEHDVSQEFGDSVFIEANQMADKLANGSIYEETSDKEMDLLELTPQPDWPCVNDMEQTDEKPKVDTEVVFKAVDKMLPTSVPAEIKLKTNKSDSTSSNENQNSISNKSNLSNNNLSRISQVSHKSEKNASKLLKNLSDILKDNDVLSKSQKSEGQNLLHSLADILRDSGSKDLSSEDSGHSSILEQDNEEMDKEAFLDSGKNESGQEGKGSGDGKGSSQRGTQSIPMRNRSSINRSIASPSRRTIPGISIKMSNTSVEFNRSTGSNASTSSVHSNGSRNASGSSICKPTVAGKLRPPKVTTSIMSNKKGPLKAVLPVADMKRHPVTPQRSEQENNYMVQSKRTSTPFHEPKLKPMAASTPASRIQKPSKEYLISPLPKASISRPNTSITYKEKPAETTKSIPSSSTNHPKQEVALKRPLNKSLINTKLESSKLQRRNSVSEVRSSPITENPKLKRSNSVGKESKIMTALSKVRQNILNSPYFDGKRASLTGAPSENSNTIGLSENTRNMGQNKSLVREIKPPSSISKLKKPGKENVAA